MNATNKVTVTRRVQPARAVVNDTTILNEGNAVEKELIAARKKTRVTPG